MKKILAIVMVLVLTLGLLAGCGSSEKKGNDKDTTNQAPSADDGIFSGADVAFKSESGDSVYRIVRSDAENENPTGATRAATYLFTQLRNTVGVNIRNMVDSAEDGTDVYEILIGDTNRPESKMAKDYLCAATGGFKDDYLIATIGKKIVIYSTYTETLRAAAEYFMSNIVKAEGIKGGIKYVLDSDVANKPVTINGAHISNFQIVRRHYNESYITQMQIDDLVKTIDSCGYVSSYAEDAYVEESTDAYEIVIGNANRSGVATITANNDYAIKISGKKVYINGSNPQATAMAVAEFGKMIKNGAALTDANSVEGNYETAVANYDKAKYYTMTWGDDFEGDGIDASKWYHVPESGYSSQGMYGRTSVRSSDPKYVGVADGKFYINAAYNDFQYLGGMIMTDRTMLYKYGYLEMSAVLPDGDGLWTSLWLDSRWHGYNVDEGAGYIYDFEIDINECFGNAGSVAANCHKWPTPEGESAGYEHTSLDKPEYSDKLRKAKDNGNFNNEYHTFGLLWNQEVMSFTCDGEIYFTYKINETPEDLDGFHTLCYLRLSAAIGFAGNPRGTVLADDDPKWHTSNQFLVDYIHLYQLDDGVQQLVIRT